METAGKKKKYLYFKIEEKIKENIENGILQPGDILPTEEELCREYNTSRVTIRRVMKDLIEQGLVERKFSQSPRVKNRQIIRNMSKIKGFTEEMAEKGMKVVSYILDSGTVDASEELAKKTGFETGAELWTLDRIRYADGKAICLQKIYLLKSICPDLDIKRLVNESLYKILKEEYGVCVERAEQTVSSVISDYKKTALLELGEKTALLKTKYKGFISRDVCIEYSENYYVGSEYNLRMEIH